MQSCQQLAKERLIKFKESQRQRVKCNEHKFKNKDLVLMRVETRQKLEPLWKGPFEIKEIQGTNAILQLIGKRTKQTVHINRLKPYFSQIPGVKNERA
jgi:hypothetical protein